jgi:hypothetical protein
MIDNLLQDPKTFLTMCAASGVALWSALDYSSHDGEGKSVGAQMKQAPHVTRIGTSSPGGRQTRKR